MAVFGLPVVREDDALRAVAAANGDAEALERLNDELEETWASDWPAGSASTPARWWPATRRGTAPRRRGRGQRRRQARTGGGRNGGPPRPPHHRLFATRSRSERVEPLELKGKAEPCPCVPAPRRSRAPTGARVGTRRPAGRPGRRAAALLGELARVLDERQCRLVTVLGEAGVGKTRLLAALEESLGDEERSCGAAASPYGRGITFWPLREAIQQAAAISDEERPRSRSAKLRSSPGSEASAPSSGLPPRSASPARSSPVEEVILGRPQAGRGIGARERLLPRVRGRALGGGDVPRARGAPRTGGRGGRCCSSASRAPSFSRKGRTGASQPALCGSPSSRSTSTTSGRVVEELLGQAQVDDEVRARIAGGRGKSALRRAAARDDGRGGPASPGRRAWVADRRSLDTSRCHPPSTRFSTARLERLGADEREVIDAA